VIVMVTKRFLGAVVVASVASLSPFAAAQGKSPAEAGFERLTSLQGEWIDADGVFGEKGKVIASYRVSGGGHTVIETFPVGAPTEMVTMYHRDGRNLALTHYCSGGTQPRMASKGLDGNTLVFDYTSGGNIDPKTTSHMHSARLEFVSADEFKTTWQSWKDGKPEGAPHTLRLTRKP
jgi:hypothetical protein